MKLLYAAKRSVAAVLVPMLLASAVCAADVTVETDPSSGMKYRAILTERESETDVTLHESTYSPYFDLPSPSIFSEYTDEPRQICEGDIYVSTDGDDSGSGTAESPFLTIERARDEIRRRREFGTLPDGGVTVSVRAGTYHMKSGIRFDSGDGGSADCPVTYTAYGDGEVILSGALELSASDFYKPSDGVASRFCDETSRHVLAADLKKYGVTSDMLSLNQTGQATMRGTNVELSVDRETYTLARYPNDSFLFSDGIVSKSGRARLIMTDDAVDRVSSCANTDNVWALGIINTDYNDSTSVVSIDTASRVLTFNNAEDAVLLLQCPRGTGCSRRVVS